MKRSSFVVLLLAVLLAPATVFAEKYYLHFKCLYGCSEWPGPTSGKLGPYSSSSSCARACRREKRDAGGSMSCECRRKASSTSTRSRSTGTSDPNAAWRRNREAEADRKRRAWEQKRRKEKKNKSRKNRPSDKSGTPDPGFQAEKRELLDKLKPAWPAKPRSGRTRLKLKAAYPSKTKKTRACKVTTACAEALEDVTWTLRSARNEARNNGYSFAFREVAKTVKGANPTTKAFHKTYEDAKAGVAQAHAMGKGLEEIERCVKSRRCKLKSLHDKIHKDLWNWLKGFMHKGTREVTERVEEAQGFLGAYIRRIQDANERQMTKAADCACSS